MEIGLWIISLLIHKDQETSYVGTRYEKHNREQDSEARNEVQDLAFRKTNRKPGCALLGPWEREGENEDPCGTLKAVSVETQRSYSSPSDWGKEEAGLWNQSEPLIEGNFSEEMI